MNFLKQVLQWLIVILIPVILALGAVRFLLTPLFVQIEYRTPNFPEDPYGLTFQDRLKWSELARVYLLNRAGIEFLGNLTFEDGSALYNERELRHMLDVKIVARAAMWVWYGSLAVILLAGVWAHRGGWRREYRLALSRGGWLTVALIVAMIAAMALSFDWFFVAFHRVFFEGETWIFRYSDTLIRLFPVRFWRDAFITVGSIALIGGILFGYFGGRAERQ
ncbi:MAG: TIGR01906 family membrane protein [Chloroflexi bacterium]|nr:TIGR01906 family membrane protein [Chloroflexota bacterium]